MLCLKNMKMQEYYYYYKPMKPPFIQLIRNINEYVFHGSLLPFAIRFQYNQIVGAIQPLLEESHVNTHIQESLFLKKLNIDTILLRTLSKGQTNYNNTF